MDKAEMMRILLTYQSVLQQWIDFLNAHHFYMEKNRSFFNSVIVASQNVSTAILDLQELLDAFVPEVYPHLKEDLEGMQQFIRNCSPPET